MVGVSEKYVSMATASVLRPTLALGNLVLKCLRRGEVIHVAEVSCACRKSLFDHINGSPTEVWSQCLIIWLLKPGLVVLSKVGNCTVAGILKVVVIFIVRMNDLPCQGNPLIIVLE